MGATGVLPCNHFTHAPHAARRATAAPGPGAAGAVTPGLRVRVAHSPPAAGGGWPPWRRTSPGPPLGVLAGTHSAIAGEKADRHLLSSGRR